MTDSIYSSTRAIGTSTVLGKTGKGATRSDTPFEEIPFGRPNSGFQDLFGEVPEDVVGQMTQYFSKDSQDDEMSLKFKGQLDSNSDQDNQKHSPKSNEYTIIKGDTLWGISRQQLIEQRGTKPTNSQILEQTQALIGLNTEIDPRKLQVGSRIILAKHRSGRDVCQETACRDGDPNIKHRTDLKPQKENDATAQEPNQIPPSGNQSLQKEGFDILSPLEFLDKYSWELTQGGEGVIESTKMLRDTKAGWHVEATTDKYGRQTKAKVFGSKSINESRGLPKNFRYSNLDNPKLIDAKYKGAGSLKFLGPAMTIASAAMETAPDVVKYNRGEINGIQLAGSATENAIEGIAVTAGSALAMAGMAAVAGGTAIATAPLWATVGAGLLIGAGVSKLYDWALEDVVRNASTEIIRNFTTTK